MTVGYANLNSACRAFVTLATFPTSALLKALSEASGQSLCSTAANPTLRAAARDARKTLLRVAEVPGPGSDLPAIVG